ncbi:protein FORGETTER 1-like isoform X2 [Anneissia japonica]|uniref:protein FORGETTER 1-like isoform X2 n=1 Tax=Anneissia japonica TaxID=1529436 RepID=UPI0014259DAC|nr:protein FORGETTER 1-like isoform X2 [Anneissia japonica]
MEPGITHEMIPAMMTPGKMTPGMMTPGKMTPGMMTPGKIPGMATPGIMTPGMMVPYMVTPGMLTPGSPTPGLAPGIQPDISIANIDDPERTATGEESTSKEVFAVYKSPPILPGAKPHPGDIVEAASLADLPSPSPTYNLQDSLPSEIITSGKLSNLQLEGILYACQKHQTILPSGYRAGFFIGDAAGVGKGRQIAGIILDNYIRGRTKHIWFSISSDLKVDAQRDLSDLGCYLKVIEGCKQLDKETRVFGLPADFKEGVIFSTYATLVSSVQKGGAISSSKQSRLDQLIKWCGNDSFDGCLIFDECHKAKHFVPGKEKNSTKVALAVASIQRLLPKARVVYCSATGVSDVKNMAFMERLGLWGDGAAFKTFGQFIDAINRRGLGIAELLAMEMKSSGRYLSRGLSFKQAEFCMVESVLSEDQVKMYNTAVHVWNELRRSLQSALDRTNTGNPKIWSLYWSAHQRFFKQICMGVKVPTILKEANKALDDGCCVVIGLQTTGEASLESELQRKDSQLVGFVSTAKEIFLNFVREYFPTKINLSTPQKCEVKVDEWSKTAQDLLLSFADKIGLPTSSLDEIIDKLGGPGKVAEMTGRKGRMVSTADGVKYVPRSGDGSQLDSLNVQERNSFMNGRKLVAIISDAASTGISLHADKRVSNQRRRVHITMELPWSADKAVQQMGRSHRANQSSGPLYKLVTTNLGGERRFAAAVAKRLESLGALTKGDRRAATGADLSKFNFDTQYGRAGLRNMYFAISNNHIAGGVSLDKLASQKLKFSEFNAQMMESLELMALTDTSSLTTKVFDRDTSDVGKFLNRILGLAVDRQNLIFSYFTECLQAVISAAKKEGRYNEGLVDIIAPSIQIVGEPKVVFTAAQSSIKTTHVILKVDRGLSWEKALERFGNHSGKHDGFYCSRRKNHHGQFMYLLATQKLNSTHLFKIARPNTGVSGFDEEKAELFSKYYKVSTNTAQTGWQQLYESAKDHCVHGPRCKHGDSCMVGSRCYRMDLLCGGILTLMSTLENTVATHADRLQLSKAQCNLRVVRVQLDNGKKLVGLRYPAQLVDVAQTAISEQKQFEQLQLMCNSEQTCSVVPKAVKTAPLISIEEPISAVDKKCLNKAMTPPLTIKNFFKPVAETPKKNGTLREVNELKTQCKDTVMLDAKCVLNLCSPSSVEKQMNKRSLPVETGIKMQPTKKTKQMSLKGTLTKQTEKKITCPICAKSFEVTTSNVDINKHIDSCLQGA